MKYKFIYFQPTTFIQLGGALCILSSLVLWAGLFSLELPDAPTFGYVRIPDLVAIAGAFCMTLGVLGNKNISPLSRKLIYIFFFWVLYGTIIGLINGNSLLNIGIEARAQVYLVLGIACGGILSDKILARFWSISAIIIAFAIVIQWAVTLFGIRFQLISGLNPGDQFTLNVPIVRPNGGFHVVAAYLFFEYAFAAIAYWPGFLLLSSMIIAQSRTYWLLLVPTLTTGFLLKQNRNFGNLKGFLILSSATFLIAIVVLNAPNQLNALGIHLISGNDIGVEPDKNGQINPLDKFSTLFSNHEVQFGVVDKRIVELNYAFAILAENPSTLVLGKGLGFIYRDIESLYYRSDPRDQERLALFLHNHAVWLVLKYGFIGICFLFGLGSAVLWGLFRGNPIQKRCSLSLGFMIIGSLLLGTFQNPSGAFLLGLLGSALVTNPTKPKISR